MKVLYIEDNSINRLVFETLLAPKVAVSCAENGSVGLEMVIREFYQIIVIDLNLNDPEMDGFDVIRLVKEAQNGLESPSIVYALTSYVGPEWEEKCKTAGFDGFFSKPLDPNKILEKHLLND